MLPSSFWNSINMLLTMLKSKIHGATVTQCDLHYEGSIKIDRNWMREVGILPNEQVDVVNLNTGGRWTTYAIEGNVAEIGVNGAGARLAMEGDEVIIMAYCQVSPLKAKWMKPKILIQDL